MTQRDGKARAVTASLAIGLAAMCAACGGAANDEADEENTAESAGVAGTPSGGAQPSGGSDGSGVLPQINFSIPTAESASLSLIQTDDTKTILERWADRTNKAIDQANSMVARLNTVISSGETSFNGRGTDGLVSGVVADSTESDFDKEALICHSGTAFLSVKWNEAGSRIEFTRDFSVNFVNPDNATALMAQVSYTGGDTHEISFHLQGTPWFKPLLVTDGDKLVEYVHASKAADGAVSLKGVNDWHTDSFPEVSGTGDGYLSGRLEADATGKFVGFRKFNLLRCTDSFTETATDSPGWCLGRDVPSSTRYSQAEVDAAWETLKNVGIAAVENLRAVAINSELSCPAPAE